MRALHIVSIPGASATNAELTSILAEYTALERVRIFRRLLLPRCVMVSVAIAVGGGQRGQRDRGREFGILLLARHLERG